MISSRWSQRTTAMGHNLHEIQSHVRDVAHDEWGRLRSSASHYVSIGRSRMSQWKQTVENEIRTHPVRWLMISAGVGIAIAAIGIARARQHR